MKGKPPFILYSHLNKPQSSRISSKYISPLRRIYARIPGTVLKETPVIEKLIHPEPKIYYNEISKYEKPKLMEIDINKMEDSQKKKINNLNEFREMFYEYNQEEREQLSNFYDVQKENDQFSHNYKKVQKEKNKFSTGTYLDHQYLIGIASRYASRGIRVPKVSVDKNVFSANPLILGGSDLDHYFLYNLGDRKKSSQFLNKVDKLVSKKLAGNTKISEQEKKQLELLKKNEKPKGYIPPNKLIPKLKNEINQTKFTYDNLENFDKFFEDLEKKDYLVLNTNINHKYIHSQSCNNIFSNFFKNKKNNKIKRIKINRNLSFIKRLQNYNNKLSSSSTKAYNLSKRFSSSNSGSILPMKDISKSNISSAVSREKSKFFKYSPILSPFNRETNNNNNLYNNLYNNITKKENNSNDFFILSKPFDYPEKNAYNILYDNIDKKNKKIIKKNLISTNRKQSALSILSRDTKNIKSEINFTKEEKEQESDEDEIRLLNKELEEKQDNQNNNELQTGNSNTNIENNLTDKNNDIQDNNNNDIKVENIFEKPKNIRISKNIVKNFNKIEPKTNKNEDNYIKIEKIFNSILGNEYKSRRSKSVINEFLKSRGYNTSKKFTSKDAYININRMKTKAIERNFLLEEFKIRNGEYSKTPLSHKQQAIIDKNKFFEKEIERNEYILKKLLCEKNINKDGMEY